MAPAPVWYVGDRNPSITDTITVDGVAVDLTTATVRFKMRAVGSSTLKVDALATVVTPLAGEVRYDWTALDVDTAAVYICWWEVTISGKVQAKQEAVIEFRPHSQGATSWLCELADVRIAMETTATDVELDTMIGQCIPVASALIMRETQREFAPATTSAARTVGARGYVVDLAPYDLRSATAVVLDPTGANQTLAANTDYQLSPVGTNADGTYTEIILSSSLQLKGLAVFDQFGNVPLAITGAWGFSTVPAIAKEACVFTVRSWLRRTYPDGYTAYSDEVRATMPPLSGYAIPLAAKSMLRPLYRNIVGAF